MLLRKGDIVLSAVQDVLAVLRGDLAHDLTRGAHDEAAGRDVLARRDERAGSDDAVIFDDRTIKDDGAHADEASILDGAAVDDGAVADGDIIADGAREVRAADMQDAQVLDVCARADADRQDITAQDAVVPDA